MEPTYVSATILNLQEIAAIQGTGSEVAETIFELSLRFKKLPLSSSVTFRPARRDLSSLKHAAGRSLITFANYLTPTFAQPKTENGPIYLEKYLRGLNTLRNSAKIQQGPQVPKPRLQVSFAQKTFQPHLSGYCCSLPPFINFPYILTFGDRFTR